MPDQHTSATVAGLAEASSIGDLADRFAEAVSHIGMTASASGMVSGPRALSGNIFHFTNWPHAWLTLYKHENFASDDPVVRWALISGEGVVWSSVMVELAANDPGQRVYKAAREHGFYEGFAMPVRARDGSLGLVSVGGGKRDPFSADERLFLQSVSGAALLRGEELLGSPAKILGTLTRREQEVVALLRQGYTDPEIGKALHLSAATVRFHIENARRKTGTRNRVELAVHSGEVRLSR